MKRVILIIAFMYAGLVAKAQVSYPYILNPPTVPPSGACAGPQIQVLASNGVIYTCNSGTWSAASGGGTGTVTSFTDSSGLFSVATATTTPTTTYATQTANTAFGNFTGSTGAPSFTATTGTGSPVAATSPTLVTPALGTPASGVITNLTGTCTSCTANPPAINYFDNFSGATTNQVITIATTQNTIQELPVYIPAIMTIANIGYQVTTADNTANTIDMGLYGPGCINAATNVPRAAHTGAVAGTTLTPGTGAKTVALTGSVTLQPGWYCWAITTNAAASAAIFGGAPSHPLPFARQTGVSGGGATLPSTITAPTLNWSTGSNGIAVQLYQ